MEPTEKCPAGEHIKPVRGIVLLHLAQQTVVRKEHLIKQRGSRLRTDRAARSCSLRTRGFIGGE